MQRIKKTKGKTENTYVKGGNVANKNKKKNSYILFSVVLKILFQD